MITPLAKRIPRELRHNFGRYVGMFALFVIAIMMTTGFLVAASSIERSISTMRDDYQMEDLYFSTDFKISDAAKEAITQTGATVYDAFYADIPFIFTDADGESAQATVRLMPPRTQINLPSYAQGSAPTDASQIALDRVFCANRGIKVGDTITIDDRELTVSGILTLPDYSCLFENNSDFMFNAQTFTISEVTSELFNELSGAKTSWRYSVVLDNRTMNLEQRTSYEEDLADLLIEHGAVLNDLVDHESNQGITFATSDVKDDQFMWEVLLVMLIIIMAFVFVVLTNATIESESSVIGTLLANGYRKRELIGHYMAVPAFVGISGCLVGNILGYALMTNPMKDLYYNSYSLPPFELYWNWRVFIITSVVPLVLLLAITFIALVRKLGATPLAFLRHEIGRQSRTRNMALSSSIPFPTRFRLRVFLRNISHFVTLFFGIAFGSILLLMALCMLPTVEHYADLSREQLNSDYVYTLKTPLELEGTDEQRDAYAALEELMATEGIDELWRTYDEGGFVAVLRDLATGKYGTSAVKLTKLVNRASTIDEDAHPTNTTAPSEEVCAQAEKLTMASLQIPRAIGEAMEEIVVYGIDTQSMYWDINVGEGRVYVGAGLAEKCALELGGTYTLTDKYRGNTYQVTVSDIWGNRANMNIYMSREDLNALLDNEPDSEGRDYFNGYASNVELPLDSRYVASVLTPNDLSKMADQLRDSMGNMMFMLVLMVVPLYFILIYLLTKTVIDRSSRVISYMKVFGYHDHEVNRLYVRTVTICVIASLVLCIPLLIVSVGGLIKVMMSGYAGNLYAYTPLPMLVLEVAIGVATYVFVAILHVRHIRRIPLAEALKVTE